MNALYFGSPVFLFGLASLVIPFLLLLSRANPRLTVSFSSLQFLASVTRNTSAVIEWKRLLLLLTRLLILCLLAMGFALPFLNREGFLFGGKSGKHCVFVLDNSFSMAYSGDGKEALFQQAKRKILEAVKARPGSTWSLVLFNSKIEPVMDRGTKLATIQKSLEDAALSEMDSDFSILLPQLAAAFPAVKREETEYLIFSDFSISDPEASKAFYSEFQEKRKLMKLSVIPVQPSVYKNFILRRIELPFRPLLPGVEEEIRVFYDAPGYAPGEKVEVTVSAGTLLKETQKVVIPASLKGSVVFHIQLPSPGHFPLRVDSPPDALEMDNHRYSVVYVHPPMNIFFLEDTVYDYPFNHPGFYFDRVLQSIQEPGKPQWLNLANATVQDLPNLELNASDFILLADVARSGLRELNKIKAYLKNGGVVLFSFGRNVEEELAASDSSRQALSQFLAGEVGEVIDKKDGIAHLSPVDYTQPFLRVFDGGRRGDLGRISFRKFVSFMPAKSPERSQAEKHDESEILLWFESRWPALIRKKIGKGTLLIWTSSLNPDWSDFSKDPLYVPFVFELLKSSVFRGWSQRPELEAGDLLSFQQVSGLDPIVVSDPKGEQWTLYSSKGELSPLPLRFSGIYEWTSQGNGIKENNYAACNINPEESSPGYISWDSRITEPEKEAASSLPVSDTGRMKNFVYPYFFRTLFLLLFLEAWMANRMYRPQWV